MSSASFVSVSPLRRGEAMTSVFENDDRRPAGSEGVPEAFFHEVYERKPLWETDRPQSEVARLLAENKLHGRVLDLGCGSGESSLLIARTGAQVNGVDIAAVAIDRAQQKAQQRGIEGVTFAVASALALPFENAFDAIVDMGVFHVFSDADRESYRENVARALAKGGLLALVCFNEQQPGGGPRRIRQEELRATFQSNFRIESIREARYDIVDGYARAWLMEAVKL